MPPINLKEHKRKIGSAPDKAIIFLLSEGTNTEPNFLCKLIDESDYFDNSKIIFKDAIKTEKDEGVTDFDGLVDLAKSIIKDSKNQFGKKDRVLLLFDLDVYATSRKKIDHIQKVINANKKKIIFGFTNPAFELFLLLCYAPNAYEKYVLPNLDKILSNKWVGKGKNKNRFIADLFSKITNIDPKDKDADFSDLSVNIQNAINQEKIYLSNKISNLSKNLVSNVGIILEKIKDNKYDGIDYLICIDN